jgi:hypothetical protein
MGLLLLVLLLILLFGAYPSWRYNRTWGYMPAGGIGLLIIIVILMAAFESVPWYGWQTRPVVVERPVTIIRPVIERPSNPDKSPTGDSVPQK